MHKVMLARAALEYRISKKEFSTNYLFEEEGTSEDTEWYQIDPKWYRITPNDQKSP